DVCSSDLPCRYLAHARIGPRVPAVAAPVVGSPRVGGDRPAAEKAGREFVLSAPRTRGSTGPVQHARTGRPAPCAGAGLPLAQRPAARSTAGGSSETLQPNPDARASTALRTPPPSPSVRASFKDRKSTRLNSSHVKISYA